jgi:hypothetical protein
LGNKTESVNIYNGIEGRKEGTNEEGKEGRKEYEIVYATLFSKSKEEKSLFLEQIT